MKITKTSIDLPEERFKALAIFMGWTEKVMTTTESPNHEIDNPQSFTDFIIEKDSAFMADTLKRFNMQEAENIVMQKKQEAENILLNAEIQALEIAKSLFEVVIE